MPINANHFFPLLRISLTVLTGACLAIQTAASQENASNLTANAPAERAASEQATGEEAKDSGATPLGSPKSPELQASEDALREHLKIMRKLQVEYHLSETSVNDKKFRREWAELCDKGRSLGAKANLELQKKFVADPKSNALLGKFLWQLLDQNMQDSRFEGTLAMALALQENNLTSDKSPEIIALSAVAENQFDIAKPWIEKHFAESEKPRPVLGVIYDSLEPLKQYWAEELRMREEDAKGEPLPQVSILTTKGEIVFELFENQAPEAVANFISLVEQGFYDGHQFHRVLEHFMAQTGCPEGDGTGGPGYSIRGEAKKPNARKFFRGSLGVALAGGNPDSGGSQFFICFLPVFNLNGEYTSFGRVVSGIEVLGCLTKFDPEAKKEDGDIPPMLDEIIEAKVVRKRDHEYKPNKLPEPGHEGHNHEGHNHTEPSLQQKQ